MTGLGAMAAMKSAWSNPNARARGGHCSVSTGNSFSRLRRKVVTKQLGAAIVQREDRHIVIELLSDRFSRRGQRLLRIVSDVLVTAFLLVLVWNGWSIFLDSFVRQAPASGLPTVIFDGALWVTCLLMVLHTAINAATGWRLRPE